MLKISIVSLILAWVIVTPCRAETTSTIRIAGGNVAVAVPDTDGVRAYKGLPYAAPPVGKLRWREPAAVPSWQGVRPINQFAANCLQPKQFSDIDPFTPSMSEDCLYLNVWTKARAGESLPVFVWIHGGGFRAGSGSEPRHDGVALAKKGVVVITINYRLGPFGFFAHPQLTSESSHHASGNYALMDMIAALRWVKQNIAEFGGDPNRVTIAGESAGSTAVSLLMASPQAKGLFHRAIGESGSAFSFNKSPYQLKEAESDGEAFAHALGAKSIKQLRQRSSAELLAAWMAPDTNWRFVDDIDGWVLPASVEDIFKSGKQNDVPMLAGWNADEGTVFVERQPKDSLAKTLQAKFDERAEQAMKFYPSANPEQERLSRISYSGDIRIAQATWIWAAAQTRTGKSPVYMYLFDHHPPVPDDWFGSDRIASETGAFHSGEIVYIFGHPGIIPTWHAADADFKLAEEMSAAWAAFVTTGNPNIHTNKNWPQYDLVNPQRMIFATPSHVAKDDEIEKRLFLESALSK